MVVNSRKSGRPIVLNGHSGSVWALAYSKDGSTIVSGSADKTCVIWDIKTCTPKKYLTNYSNEVRSLAISPDNKLLISSAMYVTEFIYWNLQSGEKYNRSYSFSDGNERKEGVLSFSPCGKYILSNIREYPQDKITFWPKKNLLWDIENNKSLRVFSGHKDYVRAAKFSPDGKTFISVSHDNTCILWDLETGKEIKTLHGHKHGVSSIAFSPEGKRALTGSFDKSCILWDIRTGQKLRTLKGHERGVFNVDITSDGKHAISTSYDKSSILWDLENGVVIARFVGNQLPYCCAVQDSKVIIGGTKGNVLFLNIPPNYVSGKVNIVTIQDVWDYEFKQYTGLIVDCPSCNQRFSPAKSVIVTIKNLNIKACLEPNQSPCLELPAKAWEHPGLLSECLNCGEKLKFNPFIAGGED